MTDHEIWLKLIADVKRENEILKEEIRSQEENYNALRIAYNNLLQEDR